MPEEKLSILFSIMRVGGYVPHYEQRSLSNMYINIIKSNDRYY